MMSVKTIISLSIIGLLTSNAWGLDNTYPSLKEMAWRQQRQQEEARRQLEEDYRRWLRDQKKNDEQSRLQREKKEETIRAEWDRELKAMGVVRWSYSAVTKFKSPRVKATIVFANGRVINYNQKIKHTLPVPTPVDIARSAQ